MELYFQFCLTVGDMAGKGLQVIFCQYTRNIDMGYKLSHTIENLIGYDRILWVFAFYLLFFFIYLIVHGHCTTH